jgi:thiamine biosynthesis lipoprotein
MSRDEHAATARAIVNRLDRVNAQMSTWVSDSELSRFNRHASTEPFPVSEDVRRVVEASRRVSAGSGGAFDVTIRPLVQAWGFGDAARIPGGPEPAELEALRARVGWHRLEVAGDALVKASADLVCDFSAVAKGFAVDAVSRDLALRGHVDHLVEIGGELRARGRRADGEAWRVAIETPSSEATRTVHRVVALRDLSMATSGDYRNYYEQDGVRLSHTIDPRSGRPIEHGLASVTVLHREAMLADAWATALNVLGPEAGFELAVEREMAAYFIVRGPRATLEARSTPSFDSLLGLDTVDRTREP